MTFKVSLINRIKDIESGKVFSGMASLLLCLFVLSACTPANDDLCIDADDWGQEINKTVVVDANKQFTSTGVNLTQGKNLEVKISGMVDLCPTVTTLASGAAGSPGSNTITPAKRGWQDSGQRVDVGDKSFNITIANVGNYTAIDGAVQTLGRGLYAYVLPDGQNISAVNGNMWWGDHVNGGPGCVDVGTDKCANFFELYNATTGVSGHTAEHPPVSGKLYFRYARSPLHHSVSDTGELDSRFSPWRGKYRWRHGCDECRQSVVLPTCAAVSAVCGPFYPICLGICLGVWEGTCKTRGDLEESLSDQKAHNPNCQEFRNGPAGVYPQPAEFPGYWGNNNTGNYTHDSYWGEFMGKGEPGPGNNPDPIDHWVNENAGLNVYNTGGGYVIGVSRGCQGRYGRYLQMNAMSNVPYTETNVSPRDCGTDTETCQACPDGYTAVLDAVNGNKCINLLNNEALTAVTPVLSHQSCAVGSWCDLNSSGLSPAGANISLPPAFHNKPGEYKGTVAYSGELWFEIVDSTTEANDAHTSGGFYDDNIGSYTVNIKTEKLLPYSEILNIIIRPLKKIIYGYCALEPTATMNAEQIANITEANCNPHAAWKIGLTQFMYNKILDPEKSPLPNAIRAGLVLLVVVYGMMFMMGMIQEPSTNFIIRVIRMAIVIQLVSPGSWEFFNQYLFTFFIDGMNQLIAIMAGDFMGLAPSAGMDGGTISNPFIFADNTLAKFLSPQTWVKMFGLLFSSPIGFIYIILIVVGMVYFVKALVKAAILYALSMLVISLLLILAPIFISFILFDSTKPYFKKWIHTLINYMFQPILVFAVLAIFNVFVFSALYTLLHYRVCWAPIVSLHIGLIDIPLMNFFIPDAGPTAHGSVLGGNGDQSGVPVGFFMILIFVIVSNLMWKMVDFMSELVGHLTVASPTATISAAVNKLTNQAGGIALGGFKTLMNPKAMLSALSAVKNPKAAIKRAGAAVKAAPGKAAGAAAKSATNAMKGAVGMKKSDK